MSDRKKTIYNIVFTMVLLLLVWGFYYFVSSRVPSNFPVIGPENGVLDVRGISFEDTIYHFVNNWDYYPGKLYRPEDFQDADNLPEKGDKRDIHLGTHRVIVLADPDTYLELASYSIDYSMRIFVNGKEVRNVGYVSENPEEVVHMGRYMTLPLYFGEDGRIEIIYQYANFVHNDGGFIQNTIISTPKNIDEYRRGLALNAMFTSCGLLFLSFYFLLCALYQKNVEFFSLCFCCFVIAFRNHYFFTEHLIKPDLSFSLRYRSMVLITSLIPATAYYLLAAFYRKVIRKIPVLLFTGMFIVLGVAHFVLEIKDLVALCHYSYYLCVPFLIHAIFCLIRYYRKETGITILELLTLGGIFGLIVVLILEGLNTGNNSSVAHFGLTPVGSFVTSMLLSITINVRIQNQAIQLAEEKHKNEVLGQVNAVNKDFLRTVAHELRTPLTVISGYAQLMRRQLEKNMLSEQADERLATIQSEADRLGNIVIRLMDYTYGQTDATEFGSIAVDELFSAAESVLLPVCNKRLNKLRLENHCTFKIHGNFELLLQVLINLVVNANRHTENGIIRIEAQDGNGFAEFLVSDTGTGISAEDAPHIFEKGFTTGSGKGLGLSICQDTLAMHGGVIELASSGSGGSTFRFTIPKEK